VLPGWLAVLAGFVGEVDARAGWFELAEFVLVGSDPVLPDL
jgi:hypothetical protein